MRGNLVIQLVAFVMGASFERLFPPSSMEMVMPLIGMLTGGVDFTDKRFILKMLFLRSKTPPAPSLQKQLQKSLQNMEHFLLP